MLTWLAANAATIIITAALLVVVGLIVRGMLRGRIRTCGDCGSCGSACGGCRFSGSCQAHEAGRK